MAGYAEELPTSDNRPFMQYIADNVDHNVQTLDGRGTFHGMGVIPVSTFHTGTFGLVSGCVPRTCKQLTALDIAKGKSVPYVCYCPRDGQGLETVCMHSFDSLRESELKPPSLAKLNVSVTVSWTVNTKLVWVYANSVSW